MGKPATPVSLPHVPQVPFDVKPVTYTRFFLEFEPYEYSGWIDECESWKKTCFIGDWSPLLKMQVEGPDALAFFESIAVNSFAKVAIGQAKHLIFCNSAGKIMGEGVLMRQSEERVIFTSGPGVAWAFFQFYKGNWNATASNITADQYAFQVQGPAALELMEKVTGESLRDIGFMRFRGSSIGTKEFDILRQGMSGEVGFELHGSSDQAIDVYNTILAAGESYGIRRLGGRAKMVNHVEACFPTPTVDYLPAMFGPDERPFLESLLEQMPGFDEIVQTAGSWERSSLEDYARTPIEMGWGKNVKFDHDFIGRAALEAEAAAPRRTMVTLVWNAEDVADVYDSLLRKGDEPYEYMEMPRNLLGLTWVDKVMVGDRLVGTATSRCYSYSFREMLSLATIDLDQATPGTAVEVIWGSPGKRQKRIRATVAPAPYKTDNRRADLAKMAPFVGPA
jgi:glycine cleavage system aminomethyltransferase T